MQTLTHFLIFLLSTSQWVEEEEESHTAVDEATATAADEVEDGSYLFRDLIIKLGSRLYLFRDLTIKLGFRSYLDSNLIICKHSLTFSYDLLPPLPLIVM